MISRKDPALQDSPPAAGRFCLWDFVKISVKYKIHENTIFGCCSHGFIVSYFSSILQSYIHASFLFTIINSHKQNITCIFLNRIWIFFILNLLQCTNSTLIPLQFHNKCRIIISIFCFGINTKSANPRPVGNSLTGLK